MNNVKKILLVVLVVSMAFCFAGCGGKYKAGDYRETSYVSYVYYKDDEATSDIYKEDLHSIKIDGSEISFVYRWAYSSGEEVYVGKIKNDKITWDSGDNGVYVDPITLLIDRSAELIETGISKSNGDDITISFHYSYQGAEYITTYYFEKEQE